MKIQLSTVIDNKKIILSSVLSMAVAFIVSCDMPPPKNSLKGQAIRGQVHFEKYCAECHGTDGKGKIIEGMEKQPADLTLIKARRDVEEFPIKPIARMIDGRQLEGLHGAREMPVWGKVLQEEGEVNEEEFKGTLGELIAYLMTIQRSSKAI